MTDFTNIRAALDNLLTMLDSTATDLVSTANTQKLELFALCGRMQITNADLCELGSIIGDAGTAMLDIEKICEDVADKIGNVVENGINEAPTANYEDFVGFCANCGNEILAGEPCSYNEDDALICGDCINAEAEQFAINFAESVKHDATTSNQ